jgi:hypothetical protein
MRRMVKVEHPFNLFIYPNLRSDKIEIIMKNMFIILLSLLSLHSFAQMRVEDIKTDKDMTKFLDEYYFKGNRKDTTICYSIRDLGRADTLFRYSYDTTVMKFLDSLNSPHWISVDINKDRKLDLVVVAYFNNDESKVFIFLSKKGGGYSYFKPSIYPNEEGADYYIKYNKTPSYLIMTAINPYPYDYDTSYHFNDRLRIDTLKYEKGIFVDYDIDPKVIYLIDTLKFSFSSFLARVRDQIIITKEGDVELYRYKDTASRWVKCLYEMDCGTIKKDIFNLAQHIPWLQYADSYDPVTTGWHDGFDWRTEVVLSDGRRKLIRDYLGTAPLALRNLYEYIAKLRKDNNWKFVKIVEKN